MTIINEGAVEIWFEDSDGKQKVTFIVDFGKTKLSAHEASNVFKSVVQTLRVGLGVELSDCK